MAFQKVPLLPLCVLFDLGRFLFDFGRFLFDLGLFLWRLVGRAAEYPPLSRTLFQRLIRILILGNSECISLLLLFVSFGPIRIV